MLYLDANATVGINAKALKAYVEFSESLAGHGNSMSPSVTGRAAANAIEKARDAIARLIGAKSSNQIIFTSTCTEACSFGLELFKDIGLDRVYSSPLEHSAIRHRYRELFEPYYLPISNYGRVNEAFEFPNNSGAICMHVQNEIGVLQPIRELKTEYLLCDMSQSLGKLPINVSEIPNLYFAAFSSHKIGGPGGVGILYIKDTDLWREVDHGSRYYMDRAGTSYGAGIVGLAAALEEAIATLPRRYEGMITFRDTLEAGLAEMGWAVIGAGAERLPNTTFVRVPRSMAVHLLATLGEAGIHIGLGSACGSFSASPPVIATALGIGGTNGDFIRISQFGEYNARDAKYLLAMLNKYLPSINKNLI
jgi:cysteine desulfurase